MDTIEHSIYAPAMNLVHAFKYWCSHERGFTQALCSPDIHQAARLPSEWQATACMVQCGNVCQDLLGTLTTINLY